MRRLRSRRRRRALLLRADEHRLVYPILPSGGVGSITVWDHGGMSCALTEG